MANKIQYGLSKLYYSVVSEGADGTLTFGVPVAIPGAVNLKIDQEGDTTTEYADNTTWKNIVNNNGYSGSLEVEILPESFRQDCLGEDVDDGTGIVTENSLVQPATFALLGQFEGDTKARRWVYYYCMASRPGAEAETKGDKIEAMHEEVDLTISPRPDNGIVRRYTNESVSDEIYNSWFTKVFEPSIA